MSCVTLIDDPKRAQLELTNGFDLNGAAPSLGIDLDKALAGDFGGGGGNEWSTEFDAVQGKKCECHAPSSLALLLNDTSLPNAPHAFHTHQHQSTRKRRVARLADTKAIAIGCS